MIYVLWSDHRTFFENSKISKKTDFIINIFNSIDDANKFSKKYFKQTPKIKTMNNQTSSVLCEFDYSMSNSTIYVTEYDTFSNDLYFCELKTKKYSPKYRYSSNDDNNDNYSIGSDYDEDYDYNLIIYVNSNLQNILDLCQSILQNQLISNQLIFDKLNTNKIYETEFNIDNTTYDLKIINIT